MLENNFPFSVRETLNKARLTALYAICLQIFRHIAQKSLAIRQYACGISMQSAEKSDYASYAQALFSVSYISAQNDVAEKMCVPIRSAKPTEAIPHFLQIFSQIPCKIFCGMV